MTDGEITLLALNSGFKLKEQPDGSMALNPYVFEFARTLLTFQAPEVLKLRAEVERLQDELNGRDVAGTWRSSVLADLEEVD